VLEADTISEIMRNKKSITADIQRLEHLALNLKGREWQELAEHKRARVVEQCYLYWRLRGFPYYRLSEREMLDEYKSLASVAKERVLLGDEIQMSSVGVKLANYFHPQMWTVRVNGSRAPLELFNDDERLRRVIRRAFKLWPTRYPVNESNMRQMLKTFSHTAGVSNFRPTAAKALYEEYSKSGDSVLDFAAGYGGRLLGCMTLKRRYVGIEPCSDQLRGLRCMVRKLRGLVKVEARMTLHQACAEDLLPKLASNSANMIFSSPPYFNTEHYSQEPSQSYIRYPTYEEWVKCFLKKVLAESHRILAPDGYLLMNVADINGFALSDDVQSLAKKHFALLETLKLRIGNRPYLRKKTGEVYKYEPIFVFRKGGR